MINGLKTVSEVDEDEDGDHDLIMLLMNDGGDHCYENEEDGDDDEVDFMLVQNCRIMSHSLVFAQPG